MAVEGAAGRRRRGASDGTTWLLLFSDLVLQMMAVAGVAVALRGTPAGAGAVPSTHQPQAVRQRAAPAPIEAWWLALLRSRPAAGADGSALPARLQPSGERSSPRRDAKARGSARGAAPSRPDPVPGRTARPEPSLADRAPAESAGHRDASVERAAAVVATAASEAIAASPVAASAADRARAIAAYLRALLRAGLGGPTAAEIRASAGDVIVSLGGVRGFPSGSDALPRGARAVLDGVRTLALEIPGMEIEVAGHADDRPIRGGPFRSNLELSVARAERVARFLGEDAPGLAARIYVTGFGEHRPEASNRDSEGRARNRRVELRLRSPWSRPPRPEARPAAALVPGSARRRF